jgi:hypothetical protein
MVPELQSGGPWTSAPCIVLIVSGTDSRVMATLRGTRGERGGAPWGWIAGLVAVAIASFAIIWWLRAGAPPVDTTGQQGVEQRTGPAPDQPGVQPGIDPAATQPTDQPGVQPGGVAQPPQTAPPR